MTPVLGKWVYSIRGIDYHEGGLCFDSEEEARHAARRYVSDNLDVRTAKIVTLECSLTKNGGVFGIDAITKCTLDLKGKK